MSRVAGPSRLTGPNWGPPILPSTSELHRIDIEDAINSRDESHDESYLDSLPGEGRTAAPTMTTKGPSKPSSAYTRRPPGLRAKAASSPYRPYTYSRPRQASSASSDESDPTSDDELSILAPPFFRDHSTGNHRPLAASSTVGQAPARRMAQRLPERALERLDRWAAGAAATKSDLEGHKYYRKVARKDKDDFDPTYTQFKSARHAPSSPPARSRRPQSLRSPIRARTAHAFASDLDDAPSAFTALAEQIGRDLKLAEDRLPSETNRPTRGDSSAETLVDQQALRPYPTNPNGFKKEERPKSQLVLPSGVPMGSGIFPGFTLPDDVTGLTSAMGSPVKDRKGVQHVDLKPDVGKSHLKARRTKLQELKSFVLAIEEELEMTKDRLDGVEQREGELRDDVSVIKGELRDGYVSKNLGVHHRQRLGADGHGRHNDGEEDLLSAKITAMTRHIAALSADMQAFRSATDNIPQRHEQGLAPRIGRREEMPRSSSPHLPHEAEEYRKVQSKVDKIEAEEYRKVQSKVDKIEAEVRRLQSVIERQHDLREPVLPRQVASDHIHGSRHGSRDELERDLRTTVEVEPPEAKGRLHIDQRRPGTNLKSNAAEIPSRQPDVKFKSGAALGSALSANGRRTEMEDSDDDDDMTQAEARVKHTLHAVGEEKVNLASNSELDHNAQNCTVCCSRDKADARRSSRKRRILQNVRRQEAGEAEEDLLLSFFDPAGGDDSTAGDSPLSRGAESSLKLSSTQSASLKKLIKQHLDEFIHQRLLYAELADEVKRMHPDSMNRGKRRTLVDHVMEAVEELEVRARKIEVLKRLLPQSRQDDAPPPSPRPTSADRRSSSKASKPAKVRRRRSLNDDGKEDGDDFIRPRPQPTTLSRALANSPPAVDRPTTASAKVGFTSRR